MGNAIYYLILPQNPQPQIQKHISMTNLDGCSLLHSPACSKIPLLLNKTPGDGFEPPLKEPESFVLPLDDPGIKKGELPLLNGGIYKPKLEPRQFIYKLKKALSQEFISSLKALNFAA